MNYLANCNPRLQGRKVHPEIHSKIQSKTHSLMRNLPSSRTLRNLSLPGIACAMALVLAATCAHAQFGTQAVGAAASQSITVTATAAGTVSSVEVLTLGSTSGDFAAGTGASTCAAANLSVGGTCTESVAFTPAEPGLRMGAVVLLGSTAIPFWERRTFPAQARAD